MATKEEMAGAELMRHKEPAPAPLPSMSRLDVIAQKLSDPIELPLPDYAEVFEDKGVNDVVAQIGSIVQSYNDGFDSRLAYANDDLMKLASLYSSLSMHVGAIQGFAHHSEQSLKVSSADLYSKSISLAETSGIKLTNSEASSLSRILTKDQREISTSYDTASRVIMNYMFAIKSFIETLQFVKGSSDREMFRP